MLRVRAGQVIGRDHMARRANCQDALTLGGSEAVAVGVVCDGCGEGAYSEVGARLAAQFLVGEADRLLVNGQAPADLPEQLYTALVGYLNALTVIAQPRETAAYVLRNLLFTVVGAVLTPDGGVVFAAGDGLIALDGELDEIDQKNAPAYPAYHLVRNALPDDYQVPMAFAVWPVSAGWERVAIATDGFESALLPQVWGFAHQRGLQRKMNVWSDQGQCFRDDAALIAFENLSTAPVAEV